MGSRLTSIYRFLYDLKWGLKDLIVTNKDPDLTSFLLYIYIQIGTANSKLVLFLMLHRIVL